FVFFYFFFQAEDGIRDKLVTGVQTCALPISTPGRSSDISQMPPCVLTRAPPMTVPKMIDITVRPSIQALATTSFSACRSSVRMRSEERRVGKECRSRRATQDEKKKKEKSEKR